MTTDTEHHERPVDDGIPELEQLKAFWRDHGTHVTIVAAVIAVAVFGTNMYRSRQQRSIADASAQLAAARTAQDLEAVVADYGSTPSAPLALLQLGKAAYDMGNYSGAMPHYQGFMDRYSDHELASVAELGVIHCREAGGDIQGAEAAFKAFADARPDHFMAPTARLGQARCMEQLGRFDDARIIYEDMVAARSDSVWGDRAAEQLEGLEERREIFNNPPAVTAPSMQEFSLPETFDLSADEAEPITIPAGVSEQ